jgi:hypothetical protein
MEKGISERRKRGRMLEEGKILKERKIWKRK